MIEDFKIEINTFKDNIFRHLERIGFCVSELLSSEKAQKDNRLFRMLTILLSSAFKTYVSTRKLDYYFEPSIVNLSNVYYSDFKGYKTGIFIIVSFCGKLTKFDFENSDYEKLYSNLNNEVRALNDEFKKVRIEHERYIKDMELLKW